MAYKQASPQVVSEGGTGAATFTDHGVLLGSGTGAWSVTATGSSGEALTSNGAGLDPTFQTISGGINGPGSSTDNALARWDGTGGDTLQDSTVIYSDNGEMTNASQPLFLAYLGTTDSNLTGDGTQVYLGDTDVGTALTELYDQNADFTTGASGGASFTAPQTARFLMGICFAVGGISSMEDGIVEIETSNRTWEVDRWDPSALAGSGTNYGCAHNHMVDLDSADTVKFNITLSGGSKVADLLGGTTGEFCRCWGQLIC